MIAGADLPVVYKGNSSVKNVWALIQMLSN